MPATINSRIDSDLLYGLRANRTVEFCFLLFSRGSICLHLICLGMAARLLATTESSQTQTWGYVPGTLELSIGILSMISLMSSRISMYFGLRTLTGIEAAISDSRTHQSRGWRGLIIYLAPLSIVLPPGDLLALALLLLLIRSNTDHLDTRQDSIFKRAEFGLATGSIAQYVGLVLFFVPTFFLRFPMSNTAIQVVLAGHTFLLFGVISVEWSITRMQRQLSSVVQQFPSDGDRAAQFLAGLSMNEG